ncbi:hypothetical protein GOBAR_AA36300 [Gossypium barbadense]|uniref:Cytochrome P450 n=1 Tax=Gossypium barbadense TaxID=3634 RepID=A0A2P5VZZ1_GOSBA|nr:hypothetical protein GOBAR_AA36300 [Gossypium barbadense]
MPKLIEELDTVVGNQNTRWKILIYLNLFTWMLSCETTIIGGYNVPKGCRVFINVWAMQRDPGLWDDPLQFQLDRFLETDISYRDNNFRYLPFGSARRMCVGISIVEKMMA